MKGHSASCAPFLLMNSIDPMIENTTIQETPWGRIVSTEKRIAMGEAQRRILGLRFRMAEYPDYVRISVTYEIGARAYYASSAMGDAFVLTDATNKRLGEFPSRTIMTKWVKSHLC